MLIASALTASLLATVVLAIGAGLFIIKPYKTWVFLQFSLVVAVLRNLKSRKIVRSKQVKM